MALLVGTENVNRFGSTYEQQRLLKETLRVEASVSVILSVFRIVNRVTHAAIFWYINTLIERNMFNYTKSKISCGGSTPKVILISFRFAWKRVL